MSENRSLPDATANNMSEEDTFNTLRRTPISEMDPIYRDRCWVFLTDNNFFLKWLEVHGWDKETFFTAGNEYDKKRKLP